MSDAKEIYRVALVEQDVGEIADLGHYPGTSYDEALIAARRKYRNLMGRMQTGRFTLQATLINRKGR